MNNPILSYPIDFICIGAQKSGTTWLYKRLIELPEFTLPYIKEIHYFDRDIKYPSPNKLSETFLIDRLKDPKWLYLTIKSYLQIIKSGKFKKIRWYYKWYFSSYSDKWYLSLFDSLHRISGDITPGYALLDDYDISRIYKLLPNIKLVFLLRNPIERAWSNYRFHIKHNKINYNEDAPNISVIINFLENESQDLRSNYIQTLKRYLKYYPNNQILIGYYDAIENNPQQLLQDIVFFLDGDTSKIQKLCNLTAKENVSPIIKMPTEIEDFLKNKYHNLIKELSKKFGSYCTRWYNRYFEYSIKENLHSTNILNDEFNMY